MNLAKIAILALVQGAAELLPVSSSAHVIVAEKLMGVDPASPQMTFLLVMLHTGTMFAVILYFWERWKKRLLSSPAHRVELAKALVLATAATGVLGLILKELIEKIWLRGAAHQEVEALFSNLPLMAVSLFAVGLLIIWAGLREERGAAPLGHGESSMIGLVQGLCLPFRGFSRSGATISSGMLLGVSRELAEDFSFALAVILTPPVIAREAWRLVKAGSGAGTALSAAVFTPGLVGMALSFVAGLLALRWLSSWLESGRWRFFGYYCLAASVGVLVVWRLVG